MSQFLNKVFIKNIAISEIVTRVHLYALLDVSIFRYFHLFKKRIKKVASHYMASNKAQAFRTFSCLSLGLQRGANIRPVKELT